MKSFSVKMREEESEMGRDVEGLVLLYLYVAQTHRRRRRRTSKQALSTSVNWVISLIWFQKSKLYLLAWKRFFQVTVAALLNWRYYASAWLYSDAPFKLCQCRNSHVCSVERKELSHSLKECWCNYIWEPQSVWGSRDKHQRQLNTD